jgi:hexosaminidase
VVYQVEPTAGSKPLTPAEEKFVLGGEVSLWGEEINAFNVFQKAFPRASAFAERMWSAKTVNR